MIVNEATESEIKLLLLEMPFKAVDQPSIGLSNLKAVARNNNYICDLKYSNLDFAKQIGLDIYKEISESLPHEALIGDLIFTHLVHSKTPEIDGLRNIAKSLTSNQLALSEVPVWIWNFLPDLQNQAYIYIKNLADELVESTYQIFGFNLMFQSTPSLAIAKEIKKRDPDRIIILGGANCEGNMGLAIHSNYKFIDYICRGEGEEFLIEFLHEISTGKKQFKKIKGIVYREYGISLFNGESTNRIDDLDSLPTPDYTDWISQLKNIFPNYDNNNLWLFLETSRGCWYGQKNHCIFCGLNGESLTYRSKTSSRALNDIIDLAKYEIQNIFASDLIFPNEYFKSFLPNLTELGLDINIFYEIKSNLKRDQLVSLSNAGIRRLQPGIESLSSPVLKIMRKGVSSYQNVRLLRWASEVGINLEWNFLYGFPGETIDSYEELIKLIPKISHLRPPSVGCNKVRLDRFSPLYFDSNKYNLKNIKPALAYQYAFPLEAEQLNNLAYHFEYDISISDELSKKYEELKHEVKKWQDLVGISTFTAIKTDTNLYLYDRRNDSNCKSYILNGNEMSIFLSCSEGASVNELIKTTGIPHMVVSSYLKNFVEKSWVVELDEKYLCLPVFLNYDDMKSLDIRLWDSASHQLQKKRILSMWNSRD